MSKVYLKNNYFNNNSISVHLVEYSKYYKIETVIDNVKKNQTISKFIAIKKDKDDDVQEYIRRDDSLEIAKYKFNKQLNHISKIINSTRFVTIK